MGFDGGIMGFDGLEKKFLKNQCVTFFFMDVFKLIKSMGYEFYCYGFEIFISGYEKLD